MKITKEECLNYKTKKLISLAHKCREDIENGTKIGVINDESLVSLENIANELLEFTKTLLIKQEDKFIGLFLMNLKSKIDFDLKAPAAITINRPIILKINPLLWIDTNSNTPYIYENFVGDLVHEVLHIVFGHPAFFLMLKNAYSGKQINYAADASVNDTIIDHYSKNNAKMTGDIITSKVIEDMYSKSTNQPYIMIRRQMDILYYLKYLDDLKDDNKQESNGGLDGISNGHFKSDLKGHITTKDNLTNREDHTFGMDENSDIKDIQSFTREKVRVIWELLDKSERAKVSNSMRTKIEDVLQSDVLNWKELFSKYEGSLPYSKKRSPVRCNRRQPYRTDIRGTLPDHIVDVVIAEDTSGSMTEDELRYVYGEIEKMLHGRKAKIEIIECDSDIKKIYEIDDFSEIDYNISGGGGTQFSPVFEHMAESPLRYQDSLLVYFTDGGGETKLSVPPVCRYVLWVITDGPEDHLSLEEPYGEVRSLLDDIEYKHN